MSWSHNMICYDIICHNAICHMFWLPMSHNPRKLLLWLSKLLTMTWVCTGFAPDPTKYLLNSQCLDQRPNTLVPNGHTHDAVKFNSMINRHGDTTDLHRIRHNIWTWSCPWSRSRKYETDLKTIEHRTRSRVEWKLKSLWLSLVLLLLWFM